MEGSSRIRRIAWATQAFLFLVGIALPLAGRIVGFVPEATGTEEKRSLAEPPRLAPTPAEIEAVGSRLRAQLERIGAFPATFESYFDDHFGFRRQLIRADNVLRARWLGVSPSPEVVIGREGWLFYAGQQGIDQYRAIDPFTEDELDAWQRRLEETNEWLADRGVSYVVLFGPAKPTVYPEHLPAWIRKVREESRLDQLLARMRAETDVAILDPRADFQRAKGWGLNLYRKTDTHWTRAGGLVAYQVLARELAKSFPSIEVLALSDFDVEMRAHRGGDIAQLMGLADVFDEELPNLRERSPVPYRRVFRGLAPATVPVLRRDPQRSVNDTRLHPGASVRDAPELPHIVLFRDSFARDMIPFLVRAVRRGVYYWQFVVDPFVVDHEAPDLVVQEIGERVLMMERFGWTPDEIGRDFELRRSFRASRNVLVDGERRWLEGELELPLEAGETTDAILRVSLEGAGGQTLRVLRDDGEAVLERALELRHEIVYVRLDRIGPGESFSLALDGSTADVQLRFEARGL